LLRKNSKLKNGKDAVFQQIPCADKRRTFAMAVYLNFTRGGNEAAFSLLSGY
jgi:hypothetical protein